MTSVAAAPARDDPGRTVPKRAVTPPGDVLGYAYPWDFEPGGGAAELVDSWELDSVAIAAAYHSVRAATPRHRDRRFVDAPHSAAYFPLRPEQWGGRRLAPAAAPWVDAQAFPKACAAARAQSARAMAWVVLTHNSMLGGRYPDVTVRNAFGDAYPHALCPSRAEVVDYAVALASAAVEAGSADGVVLEATAALGAEHGAAHDKAKLTAPRAQQLSVCFCAACTGRYDDAGLESAELRRRLLDAVRSDSDGGLSDLLGPGPAATVHEVRQASARALIEAVVDGVRQISAAAQVIVHTSNQLADYTASGTTPVAAAAADVAACWVKPDAAQSDDREPAGRSNRQPARAAIIEYTHPAFTEPASAGDLLQGSARFGGGGLHIYHLGLLSDRTAGVIGGGLRAARAARAADALPGDH